MKNDIQMTIILFSHLVIYNKQFNCYALPHNTFILPQVSKLPNLKKKKFSIIVFSVLTLHVFFYHKLFH